MVVNERHMDAKNDFVLVESEAHNGYVHESGGRDVGIEVVRE
jgi:hypothetical protein